MTSSCKTSRNLDSDQHSGKKAFITYNESGHVELFSVYSVLILFYCMLWPAHCLSSAHLAAEQALPTQPRWLGDRAVGIVLRSSRTADSHCSPLEFTVASENQLQH